MKEHSASFPFGFHGALEVYINTQIKEQVFSKEEKKKKKAQKRKRGMAKRGRDKLMKEGIFCMLMNERTLKFMVQLFDTQSMSSKVGIVSLCWDLLSSSKIKTKITMFGSRASTWQLLDPILRFIFIFLIFLMGE